MRLIDADALHNAFESEMCKECSACCVDEYGHCNCPIHYMKELLWQQPTAYDVDKVVEELDSAEYPFYLFDVDGCDVDESLLKADMVESIVRRGGVND